MAGHTVAANAGRLLALEKENTLQDKRISAVESSTTSLLIAMRGVETSVGTLVEASKNGKPKAKTIALRRIAETAITSAVIGGIILIAILIFAGRLDADDIANILRAWKGGS